MAGIRGAISIRLQLGNLRLRLAEKGGSAETRACPATVRQLATKNSRQMKTLLVLPKML